MPAGQFREPNGEGGALRTSGTCWQGGSVEDSAPIIAIVVPCYRVSKQIEKVIRGLPDSVHHIVIVDDCCPESSGNVASAVGDPRVVVLRHDHNQGVGAAMKTGFAHALQLGADIVVKMDGDDQMDPLELPHLLEPLVLGRAAFTKGNRLWDLDDLTGMPLFRRVGNVGLSFLVKFASGYWHMSDPANGFLAIRSDVLRGLRWRALGEDYFFETSLIIELGRHGYRIEEVAMRVRYGTESSSLSVLRILRDFPIRLAFGGARRIFYRHFWMDFTASALLLLVGAPLVFWGLAFGSWAWFRSIELQQPASAGTVMLAGLPFIVGINLLLHALSYEMAREFNQRIRGRRVDR